jgi:hypothetical protein
MTTGHDLSRAGALKPGATLEDNPGLIARTDALRSEQASAIIASIDRTATRAVPLETILPFALLGGNAIVHDYLLRRRRSAYSPTSFGLAGAARWPARRSPLERCSWSAAA